AWKYGERAFRYCQHDLGHAIAAIAAAAALTGWRVALLPTWSHRSIAALTGIDRDEDFIGAEREEPGALMAIAASGSPDLTNEGGRQLVEGVQSGRWFGHASQLSVDHVEWTFINEIARATEAHGLRNSPLSDTAHPSGARRDRQLRARAIIRQRRSAIAFDGPSAIERSVFVQILSSVMPGAIAPWTALWWTPRIHLALFVHRVKEVPPGLYLLPRDPGALAKLRAACRRDFRWETADEQLPLLCLTRGDCRSLAARLSCDQDVAADGF